MDLYEKFRNELESPVDFSWREEWHLLTGVEEFINYPDQLVGVSNLKKFNPRHNFKENFTGFVDSKNVFFNINDNNLVLDSIFIENGRIKYGAFYSDLYNSVYKKNRFFQDNFSLTKIYDIENNNKLSQVHVVSSFKVKDYKINFFRLKKEEGYFYLSKNTDDWFDFMLNEDRLNLLEKKVFEDLHEVRDFFKGVKGNFFRNFNLLEKVYSFEEALKFIR